MITYTRCYVNMPPMHIHCTATQVCDVLGAPDALSPIEVNLKEKAIFCRSQWPYGLWRGSAAARLLGWWV